jgi:hypothetical protein
MDAIRFVYYPKHERFDPAFHRLLEAINQAWQIFRMREATKMLAKNFPWKTT